MSDFKIPEKKVDESWKEEVEKEKRVAAASAPPKQDAPGSAAQAKPQPKSKPSSPRAAGEPNFITLISSLAMQAYAGLGEAEDPIRGRSPINLAQAKYMIDILGILEEKSQGNLTEEEAEALTTLLYELRMKFMEKTQAAHPPTL